MNTVITLCFILILFYGLLSLVRGSPPPSWRKPCDCGMKEKGYCNAEMYQGSMRDVLKCNKYRRNAGMEELPKEQP